MCVERTARTKLPSARGSRASVARQKRAAARGEMLDLEDVLLMFMVVIVSTPKIAQTDKQFYPERHCKVYRESRANLAARHDV
jgi:hypothetical protein